MKIEIRQKKIEIKMYVKNYNIKRGKFHVTKTRAKMGGDG